MKNKNILLTFVRFDGYQAFNWFKDVNEVNNFVNNNNKKIREIEDCIEIMDSNDVKSKLEDDIQKEFILNKDAKGWVTIE